MTSKKEDNLIIHVWGKFYPYWPVFLILIIAFISSAWLYLKFATPVYKATASITIKDEKKGSDDSKMTESLDYLSSKKIVENEIEVLRSRLVMKQVVNDLFLGASVYQQGKFIPKLLYKESPVKIQYQNTDTVTNIHKVPFSYDDKAKQIVIGKEHFNMNEWVNTSAGSLKFIPYDNFKKENNNAKYFFTIISPRAAINNFTPKLTVESLSKLSSVLALTYLDESPERAEDILRGILNGYNLLSLNEKDVLAHNMTSFVDQRMSIVKKDLDSIEHSIQQYKSNKGASEISSQGMLYLQNVSSNDQKLSEVSTQLAILKEVKDYLNSKNNFASSVPSTVGINDPGLTQLLNKLYEDNLEYDKLQKTTGENNPAVQALKDEINKLKPTILENIETQRKSLEASKNNLNATNGSYSSNLQAIPQKERELVSISREYATKSAIYNFLLQKREEAALSNSTYILNNKIVNEPEASADPVSPKKLQTYLLAFAAALIISVLLILGKELMNTKVLYRTEIENITKFPVVSEIFFEKSKEVFVIQKGKRSVIAEQFRKLRSSLGFMKISSERKKILVTSTVSGDGKSFVVANLGLSLAMVGKKVIMVELDLSNPNLSVKLKKDKEIGAANYLNGETIIEDIIYPIPENENLFLIPSGTLPEDPSELLMNGKVEILLEYLSDKYDYIIIDTAPVGALSDAYVLSPLCDATLYVVRHNHTPKVGLKQLDINNKITELKNISIIFNGIQRRGYTKTDYGYGYSYGYVDKPKSRFRLNPTK